MSSRDWKAELDFSPEELADMGAALLDRGASPPAAAASPPSRRRRPSSLRIPVDAVPRGESGRVAAGEEAPSAPVDGGRMSESDVVVERAFQSTTRGFLQAMENGEVGEGASLDERSFEQTLRGYSAADSAVPILMPSGAAPAPTGPSPPSAATSPTLAPSTAGSPPAAREGPADDAIALDDADVIMEQGDGAGSSGARPEWPENDTPPMGSELAAAAAPAADVAAVPPAEDAERARGESAFPKVDTVPEAPAEPPPPAPPAVESARTDSAVVLSVFDAFDSRPNSILRTDLADEAQRPAVVLVRPPAPAAPAAAAAPAGPVPDEIGAETTAPVDVTETPDEASTEPAESPGSPAGGELPASPTAALDGDVAPKVAAGAEGDEPSEELSGADLEEIPDIIADQVMAGPPAAAADEETDHEDGPAAVEMMAAAMVSAPRQGEEDEAEVLSGADLEEVHEASPPAIPPTPVTASQGPAAEVAKAPPPTPVVEPAPVRRRRKRPWYEEVFDEDYLRTLPFLTPEQTRREVAFLEDGLALAPDMRVLDVGCGYGRHAMELAVRGYPVTGIDLSLALLIRAADEAQRRGLQVNFVHGDMRELTFDEPFDAAYSMGTSFGFFDDETNRKVFQGIAAVVKPGGRFLIEAVNRDYIVNDLPARVWWEGDGCVVLEEVEFNYYTSRLMVRRSVVFEDGRQLEHDISVRVYSLHEIGRILQYAGFRVLDVSGHLSTRGRFFGAASRQLLVVAERRGTSSSE